METKLQLCLSLILVVEVCSRSANTISMSQDQINNRPIIGILTEPTNSKYGDEYIMSAYVQFLESAGARVVPIRGKQPPKYYSKLFKKINGVLFPGGGANTTTGPYYESGKAMYELALKANDKGDYFPIWATCLGMELLTVLTSKKWILGNTDAENISLPLTLTEGYRHSRLFKHMPDHILEYLRSEPVTMNNHQYGLLTKTFNTSSKLKEFYKVLSTNQDRKSVEFVSLLEAYEYPIYASQWHPEKNVFIWKTETAINHSFHALQVTQYIADFFVNEARKSNHHFDSEDEAAQELIENARRVFIPDSKFTTDYYFNYNVASK